MTKAIELADKLDYLADNDAENWQTLGNAAAELRRLAAVEQELASNYVKELEPLAVIHIGSDIEDDVDCWRIVPNENACDAMNEVYSGDPRIVGLVALPEKTK